jgi:hypothetical protein
MKKFVYSILVVLTAVSCGKASKVQSAAEERIVQLFKEVAKVPESVKVDNIKTMFSDDSLCILNANFTAKNGFGNESTTKYEYVYLVSKGVAYETYESVGDDNVYIKPEDYDREKKGKIYEHLPYEQAIRHLASIKVITSGRAVGDKDNEDVDIPMSLSTGLWEKRQFTDSFNDKTQNSFLLLTGKGAFSNSATTGSEMTALLFVTKKSISLMLVEYSSSLVKDDDSYILRVKDADEVVHYFRLYNDYDGDMTFSSYSGEGEDGFRKLLEKGGIVTCMAEESNSYGTPSKYYFKLHLDGYNEAIGLI